MVRRWFPCNFQVSHCSIFLVDAIWIYMVVSENRGTPKSSISRWDFPWNKPSILGYPVVSILLFYVVFGFFHDFHDLILTAEEGDIESLEEVRSGFRSKGDRGCPGNPYCFKVTGDLLRVSMRTLRCFEKGGSPKMAILNREKITNNGIVGTLVWDKVTKPYQFTYHSKCFSAIAVPCAGQDLLKSWKISGGLGFQVLHFPSSHQATGFRFRTGSVRFFSPSCGGRVVKVLLPTERLPVARCCLVSWIEVLDPFGIMGEKPRDDFWHSNLTPSTNINIFDR